MRVRGLRVSHCPPPRLGASSELGWPCPTGAVGAPTDRASPGSQGSSGALGQPLWHAALRGAGRAQPRGQALQSQLGG